MQFDRWCKRHVMSFSILLLFFSLATNSAFSQTQFGFDSEFASAEKPFFGGVQSNLPLTQSIADREHNQNISPKSSNASRRKSMLPVSSATRATNENSPWNSVSSGDPTATTTQQTQLPQNSTTQNSTLQYRRPTGIRAGYPANATVNNHHCHCHQCLQAAAYAPAPRQPLPPTLKINQPAYRYGDFGAKSYPQFYQQKGYNNNRTDWAW